MVALPPLLHSSASLQPIWSSTHLLHIPQHGALISLLSYQAPPKMKLVTDTAVLGHDRFIYPPLFVESFITALILFVASSQRCQIFK